MFLCFLPAVFFIAWMFKTLPQLRQQKKILVGFFFVGIASFYAALKLETFITSFLPPVSFTAAAGSLKVNTISHNEIFSLWLQALLSVGLSEELVKVLPALCVLKFLKNQKSLLFFAIVMTGLGLGTFETLYAATISSNLQELIPRIMISIPIHLFFATIDAWIVVRGLEQAHSIYRILFSVIVIAGFLHGTFDALLLGPDLGKIVAILAIIPFYIVGILLLKKARREFK